LKAGIKLLNPLKWPSWTRFPYLSACLGQSGTFWACPRPKRAHSCKVRFAFLGYGTQGSVYGFKGHVWTTAHGRVLQYRLESAHHHDSPIAHKLNTGWTAFGAPLVIGDKAYVSDTIATPPKANRPDRRAGPTGRDGRVSAAYPKRSSVLMRAGPIGAALPKRPSPSGAEVGPRQTGAALTKKTVPFCPRQCRFVQDKKRHSSLKVERRICSSACGNRTNVFVDSPNWGPQFTNQNVQVTPKSNLLCGPGPSHPLFQPLNGINDKRPLTRAE